MSWLNNNIIILIHTSSEVPKMSNSPWLQRPHNYYNSPPSNAWHVSVADSVGLCLAVAAVAIRCYTKLRITKSPGWEDGESEFTRPL